MSVALFTSVDEAINKVLQNFGMVQKMAA